MQNFNINKCIICYNFWLFKNSSKLFIWSSDILPVALSLPNWDMILDVNLDIISFIEILEPSLNNFECFNFSVNSSFLSHVKKALITCYLPKPNSTSLSTAAISSAVTEIDRSTLWGWPPIPGGWTPCPPPTPGWPPDISNCIKARGFC